VGRLLSGLAAAYGPQHWWPAETPFEVMVGAVLTQNTAWTNVERAIANLRAAGALDPETLAAMAPGELAPLLRPAGYFNVKAARLQAFCRWLLARGGLAALAGRETHELRRDLLSVRGVGPETADDILLYALHRPVFVIDAYTRRILARLGLAAGDEPYDQLRVAVEDAIGPDVAALNELHALLVVHAKAHCRARAPRCEACPLAGACPYPGA
jgi:endonuclease-3 related protein